MGNKRGVALLALVAPVAIVVLAVGGAVAEPGLDRVPTVSKVITEGIERLSEDRPVALVHDRERGELVILHGPVDLPGSSSSGHGAHASHDAVFPAVSEVTVPIDGFVFGFYADLVDGAGRPLPSHLLHHVNLVDPDQRELFAPISMRVAAAGKETGAKGMPPRLFGLPVRKGQRLVIHSMLHNGTEELYESVVLRFHLRLSPEGREPLFPVYPFWVDVQLPAGDKTFDLPPGRSSHSYDGRPAVPGRILALSGHMHEQATRIRFEDATTGETLWEAAPELDESGGLIGVPIGRQFLHLGDPITPDHTYRLTVDYDNKTGTTLVDGGMGSIGGIFLPERGVEWPNADASAEIYQLDLKHYYRELLGKLDDLKAAAASSSEPQDGMATETPAHVH